jgi:hypothetical protein
LKEHTFNPWKFLIEEEDGTRLHQGRHAPTSRLLDLDNFISERRYNSYYLTMTAGTNSGERGREGEERELELQSSSRFGSMRGVKGNTLTEESVNFRK